MVKGERWWENGLQNWEECVFKKKVKEESVFIWAEAIFSCYFQDVLPGLSWLDILLWMSFGMYVYNFFVFPQLSLAVSTVIELVSFHQKFRDGFDCPQILTVLLRIFTICHPGKFLLSGR